MQNKLENCTKIANAFCDILYSPIKLPSGESRAASYLSPPPPSITQRGRRLVQRGDITNGTSDTAAQERGRGGGKTFQVLNEGYIGEGRRVRSARTGAHKKGGRETGGQTRLRITAARTRRTTLFWGEMGRGGPKGAAADIDPHISLIFSSRRFSMRGAECFSSSPPYGKGALWMGRRD